MIAQRAVDAIGLLNRALRPAFLQYQFRDAYLVRVREFDVELYGTEEVRFRRGPVQKSERLLDFGVWRIGGYVRWERERDFRDFFLLDEIDEELRSRFPKHAGTIHRADQPVSNPYVRLSSVR